jgi:hypothetical protein
MVASEPPHRLRDEPRKRRPTGVAKRWASLPEGADMAEVPPGPIGALRDHPPEADGEPDGHGTVRNSPVMPPWASRGLAFEVGVVLPILL